MIPQPSTACAPPVASPGPRDAEGEGLGLLQGTGTLTLREWCLEEAERRRRVSQAEGAAGTAISSCIGQSCLVGNGE